MAKKKKTHPRSQFKNFSGVLLSEVQVQVDKWIEENSHLRILKKSTIPKTNSVVDGVKWYEIEIECLE